MQCSDHFRIGGLGFFVADATADFVELRLFCVALAVKTCFATLQGEIHNDTRVVHGESLEFCCSGDGRHSVHHIHVLH